MILKKHIEIIVKADVTAAKPYYLVCDYIGEEEFLNRILNVSNNSHYKLVVGGS